MSLKTRFHVTVTTLSPLHIGSGERLREGFDFIAHEGAVWIPNQGALMGAVLDVAGHGRDLAEAATMITGKTLYELRDRGWLREDHFDPARHLFHYRLPGHTSTANKQGELHEEIKDLYRRPYLPGSTLKGSLRTLIAQEAVRSRKLSVTVNRLDYRPKFATLPVEREIFGRNPNFDLLRALQVGDSAPVGVEALGLATARLFPPEADRDKLGIDVEATVPGTRFALDIAVDEYLLSDSRTARLRFGDRRSWLFDLAKIGKRQAKRRVLDEVNYFKAIPQPGGKTPPALQFYARLVKMLVEEELAADEFLLQLGWGAGWDSKTLDGELRKDPTDFARIINKFHLAEGPQRGFKRGDGSEFKPGDTYPATRKLATMSQLRLADQPMGWVKVKIEPE
jgi:CRISPR-associated protein Csm5